MAKPRFVLHIGYPKTGTSAIQWFFNHHREDLRRQSVYYPTTGQGHDHGHHKLVFSLAENTYQQWGESARARLFEDLAAEIDGCGCDTVVLSSEMFLSRLEAIQASEEFARVLGGLPSCVVCFLRRQDTFLESLYRQFIWDTSMRFTGSPEAFLDAYKVAGDYHPALTAWAGFVGRDRLVTEVYEQAVNGEGCIKRMCRLVGVDPDAIDQADFGTRRNIAPAASVATDLMRITNGHDGLSVQQRRELALLAMKFAESISHLPLPTALFSREDAARIQAMFSDSNRRLAEDFVHRPLDGFWFKESAGVETGSPAATATSG
jgi:hypothetical protein